MKMRKATRTESSLSGARAAFKQVAPGRVAVGAVA
jgi:hypothetical protein